MATAATLPLTPARRVWLAIGVPVCLVLIANTGLSLVATLGHGSFPVRYVFPSRTTTVGVSVSGGQLDITGAVTGGQATQAEVTGTARYSIVHPHITTTTTRNGVTYHYDCRFPYGSCGFDATLTVPASQAVTASTDGGNALVTGTSGAITISSGGGDITADRVSGTLALHTNGGNIRGTAVTAPSLAASSGGGDITITFTTVPRDVHVSTDGGNITLILPPGAIPYHVTARTDGGTVTDRVPRLTSSLNVITATSGGGDINIIQAP